MKASSKTIVIVTANMFAPGVLSLHSGAVGFDCYIKVVEPDDIRIVDILNNAYEIIFRIGPLSYQKYATLLIKLDGIPREKLESVLGAFDKKQACSVLDKASIPMPQSWTTCRDASYVGKLFVIKIAKGNQGKGVKLIHSQKELDDFFSEYVDEDEFLSQEFIAEAASGDKRLFIVGQKVVASMRRQAASDDFRANLHLGGHGEDYTPTEEEVIIAQKSIVAFGLLYGGVDIIDSKRGPLVLEVNPSPGFGISEVTKINVAQELIKYILGESRD